MNIFKKTELFTIHIKIIPGPAGDFNLNMRFKLLSSSHTLLENVYLHSQHAL